MRAAADSDQIVDMELAAFAAAGSMQMPLDRTNTTISCIVTNVELTKAQATKVSQMAADAYAHAIRPTHTTNDGDTIYTLASGKLGAQASAAVPLDLLGMLAVRALETAIVNGAKTAKTSHGIPGARSSLPDGCPVGLGYVCCSTVLARTKSTLSALRLVRNSRQTQPSPTGQPTNQILFSPGPVYRARRSSNSNNLTIDSCSRGPLAFSLIQVPHESEST